MTGSYPTESEGRVLFLHPAGTDRDLYVSALREARLELMVADDADSATQILGTSGLRPDLIITELLPDPLAAWAFAGHQRGRTPETPIIILTSLIRPDRANRDRAQAIGCAAFVAKPCSLSLLVHVVLRVRLGTRGLEVSSYDLDGLRESH
jgi:CheY-like chemotaxis protein